MSTSSQRLRDAVWKLVPLIGSMLVGVAAIVERESPAFVVIQAVALAIGIGVGVLKSKDGSR